MKRASLIIARRLPLVEQERPTRPDHKSSPPSFRGVRVDHSSVSLVLIYVQCFVDHDLSLLSYLFWPLYCLSFYFILVTPLVSPSISFDIKQQ
jgi:hypothetical protein